ncbi:MAG: hypothetical protein JW819_13845 [Candidatus Krumholzibacteriota bacterium]|nr:hypothetical protein [Candidatus Krumholzibacteriota bacterium]
MRSVLALLCLLAAAGPIAVAPAAGGPVTAAGLSLLPDSLYAEALDALGVRPEEVTCFPETSDRDSFRLAIVDSLMAAPSRLDVLLPPVLDGLLAPADSADAADLAILAGARRVLHPAPADARPPLVSLVPAPAGELVEPAIFFTRLLDRLLPRREAALALLTPDERARLVGESPHLLDELEDTDTIRHPVELRRLEQAFSDRADSALALWARVDRAALYGVGASFVREALAYARRLAEERYAEPPAPTHREGHRFADGSTATGELLLAAATEHGNIAVGGAGANAYEGDFLFILDLGGADTYRLASSAPDSAAGADLGARGFRCLYDRGGDDRWTGLGDAALAGAFLGGAVLLDEGGDDAYLARSFDLGCGWLGVGVLVDTAGDDLYAGDRAVMGAGGGGLGLLRDLAGGDVYRAHMYAQGFGWVAGVGVLEDREGGDLYAALPKYTDILRYEDHSLTLAQGFAIGARPDFSGGVGLLSDAAGNDAYLADIYGQGSAYWYALGILWDRAGNDRYDAYQYAQGAGIHLAVGLLLDDAGHDAYTSNGVGQGCGHDLAFGLLRDLAGNERYSTEGLSLGAGSANGVGVLLDATGEDGYLRRRPDAVGYGNPRRHFGSLGLAADGAGDDWLARPSAPGAERGSLRGVFLDRDAALAGPVWDPGEAVPYEAGDHTWEEYFLMAASGEPRFREWQRAGLDSLVAHPECIGALVPFFDTKVARQRHTLKDVMLGIGAAAVDPLREVLREGPREHWGIATWSLEVIRDARAYPELMARLLSARDHRDRTAALAALARLEGLDGRQKRGLAAACTAEAGRPGAHPMMLKELAYCLGQQGVGESALLVDLAAAGHYAPRWTAREALAGRTGWGGDLARAWRRADSRARLARLAELLPLRPAGEVRDRLRDLAGTPLGDDPALRRALRRALDDHPAAGSPALAALRARLAD